MRRAAKVDANQAAIVDALLAAGCKVLSLAAVGNGVADLLVLPPFVIYHDRDWCEDCDPLNIAFGYYPLTLLEVKNPAGRGTSLTPDQVKFHADWPVTVVTTPEEALRAVGLTIEGDL